MRWRLEKTTLYFLRHAVMLKIFKRPIPTGFKPICPCRNRVWYQSSRRFVRRRCLPTPSVSPRLSGFSSGGRRSRTIPPTAVAGIGLCTLLRPSSLNLREVAARVTLNLGPLVQATYIIVFALFLWVRTEWFGQDPALWLIKFYVHTILVGVAYYCAQWFE